MKLTLADPKYFKDSVSIIGELVSDARFNITPNGVEVIAMDPANVAMVIYKLFSSSFVEYDVKKPVQMGINLGSLKQVLRRIKANDVLTMELEGETRLKITLKSNIVRTFNLPIIEMDEREQKKEPDLKFPVTIQMPASVFNDAIEDADIVSDAVTIIVEKQKMQVVAEGDLSKANIEIKSENDIKIEATDKVKAKYSIEYLKKMIGGSKIASNMTIRMNNDYPIRLEYKEVDKVMLAFILAPRVEND